MTKKIGRDCLNEVLNDILLWKDLNENKRFLATKMLEDKDFAIDFLEIMTELCTNKHIFIQLLTVLAKIK